MGHLPLAQVLDACCNTQVVESGDQQTLGVLSKFLWFFLLFLQAKPVCPCKCISGKMG